MFWTWLSATFSDMQRPRRHKVTVERMGRFWWWGCLCGHFGYGDDYDRVLSRGVMHADLFTGAN